MLKRNKKSLRKKMIVFVALISTVLFSLTSFAFLLSYYTIQRDIQKSYTQKASTYVQANLQEVLDQTTFLRDELFYYEYKERYIKEIKSLSQEEREAATRNVKAVFESLNVYPDIVKSVILLGDDDENNLIFGETDDIYDLKALSYIDLLHSNAISKIYKGYGAPALFAQDEIKNAIGKRIDSPLFSEEKREALLKLCKITDDEIVSCIVMHPVSMIIVYNKQKVLEQIQIDSEMISVSVFDEQGDLLYTNDSVLQQDGIVKEITFTGLSTEYKYTIVLKETMTSNFISVIIQAIALCLVLLLIVNLTFIKISKIILKPLENVANQIGEKRNNPKNDLMTLIPAEVGGKTSLSRRISFFIIGIVLFGYIILCAVFFSVTSSYAKKINQYIYALDETMLSQLVEKEMHRYSSAVPYTYDEILKNEGGGEKLNIASIQQLFNRYKPELLRAKLIMIVDEKGGLKYISSFPKDYAQVDQLTTGLIKAAQATNQNISLLSYTMDMYGNSGFVWVKKTLPNEYVLIFMDDSVFKSDLFREYDYIISDKNNDIIYSSGNIAINKETLQKRHENNTLSINQVAYKVYFGNNSNYGFEVTLLHRQEDANRILNNFVAIMRNIIIVLLIVVIAVSYLFALYIKRRLTRLQYNIKMTGQGVDEPMLFEDEHNEIYHLIKTYNQMIKDIKRLTEDKITQSNREQTLLYLKTQAELKALQQQIDPHFLFNSLSIITLEARKLGNDKIIEMVGALSQIVRFGFGKSSQITVWEEIENIERYVFIQKARYDNAFELNIDVADNVRQEKILRLLIQPLIENAIEHGLYERESDGVINLSIQRQDDKLEIVVSDNGIGMDEDYLERLKAHLRQKNGLEEKETFTSKGNGIALKNTYQRIKVYYDGQAMMYIESKTGKGTKIIISLPLKHE